MKKTVFKRISYLLTIGIAFLLLTPAKGLCANVFATEVKLIEYDEPKFYFEDNEGIAYEFSVLKTEELIFNESISGNQIVESKIIGISLKEIQKNRKTIRISEKLNDYLLSTSEIKYEDYIELSAIINKNFIAKEQHLIKYDLHKDNQIDVRDVVCLQNYYLSTPTNFLIDNDGNKMQISMFFRLIQKHRTNGEKDFIVFSNDKIDEHDNPAETETTDVISIETTVSNTEMTTIHVITLPEEKTTEPEITVSEDTTTTTPEITTVSETTTEPEITVSEDTTTTTPEITTVSETTTAPEVTTLPETTTFVTTVSEVTTTVTDITTAPSTTVTDVTTTESSGLPIDPDGWEIEQEIYDSLVYSAKLFGISNYKIIWTEKEVMNSIVYVEGWFADIYNLQQTIPIQLCSLSELKEKNKEFEIELGLNIETYNFEHFVWRPIISGNWQDEKFQYNGYRCELIFLEGHAWKYQHWCLIPLDENGNEDLRILEDAKKKSFINNSTAVTPDGKTIPPDRGSIVSSKGESPSEELYYSLIQGAKDFGFDRYEFRWTETPIYGSVISTANNLGWYYRYSFFSYVDEVRFVDREYFVNEVLDMSLIDPEDYYNDDILFTLNSKEYNDFIYIEIEEGYDITRQPLLNVNRGLDGKLYCWSIATPESGFVFPKLCIVPLP